MNNPRPINMKTQKEKFPENPISKTDTIRNRKYE